MAARPKPKPVVGVIMGSDSFLNLSAWKNYKELLKEYPIFVYERPAHKMENNYEHINLTILKAPLLEISSSYIRKNISEGKSIRYLVPDKVRDEIERNGYYRNQL